MSVLARQARRIAGKVKRTLFPPPPPALHTGAVDVIVTRHGWMLVPRSDTTIGESLRRYGEWAESEIRLMSGFVAPGGTVLEVGANLGAHTLAFAQMVGRQGRVIAVEPQRYIHACLSGSVAANGHTQVLILNALAGDRTDHVLPPPVDYAKAGNFGAVHFRDVHSTSRSFEAIPMICADDLNLDRLDLVKIDAEGMEAEVLRGMAGTLERLHPALFVEATTKGRAEAVEAVLHPLGYRGWTARATAYNPDNFRGDTYNIFGGATETNVLYLTEEQAAHHAGALADLPPFAPADMPS